MQKIATEKTVRTPSEPIADSHNREFELLRLTARTTIDSHTRERIGSLVDTAIDWNFLAQTAHEHRVLPLIYRTFADGYSDRVPKHAMERLRKAFYANAKRNLFLTANLLQLLKHFEENNIPAISYKGPILSAALYGEVSMRQFSDLDVIVPKNSVQKATNL